MFHHLLDLLIGLRILALRRSVGKLSAVSSQPAAQPSSAES
jgi:hypothetical protein